MKHDGDIEEAAREFVDEFGPMMWEDVRSRPAFKTLDNQNLFLTGVLYGAGNALNAMTPKPDKLLCDMNEPELSEHLNKQLRFIKASQTEDTIGSMLIIFQKNGISQYGATVDPETAPQALRELADRIERRETVKRDGR